jgi:hypothetical protein
MKVLSKCRMSNILGQPLMVRTFALAVFDRIAAFKLFQDLRRETCVHKILCVGRYHLRWVFGSPLPLPAT